MELVKPEDNQNTTAISLDQIANNNIEESDIKVAPDPVKDILVFPHQNNRTYRAGYIQLMAFSNDVNLKNIQGEITSTLDFKQTHTKQRDRAPTFNGSASAYLANARANNRRQRKIPGTKLVFTAILPLPLSIGETTAIEWNSSPSGFNKSIVGAAHEAEASIAQYLLKGGKINPDYQPVLDAFTAGAKAVDGWSDGMLGKVVNGLADSMTLGTNIMLGHALGDTSMHTAAMGSVAGSVVTKPNSKMLQLQGPIMDYAREAAALNGRRQIIMDPGYWQSFQGVNPRNFTLSWSIIPENHEDAMNGLALCARIKEFSLPESLNSVELLSPHYWQIQFSNPAVQSQTLYGNLVIKNIDVKFMENGELHLSGTPKKFDISITFEEAKASTAETFKMYNEALTLSGGKIRNSPSAALGSIGGIISKGSGDLGGFGKLTEKFGGKFGKLGSSVLGKLGGLKDKVLGKVAGIVGDKLGGFTSAISGSLGGAVGSVFGDYAGNLIADATSNALNSAGSVLTNAIATGDFSNLGDKMKDAALAGATSTVIDAVSETANEYIGKVTDFAMDKLGDTIAGVEDWFGNITGDVSYSEKEKNEKARDAAREAKDQKKKVEDLRKKLEAVDKSTDITPDQKEKARKKVEQEYKKAQDLAKKAEQAKKAAEAERKKEEAKREAEKKRKEQEKANKKANKDLKDILGN